MLKESLFGKMKTWNTVTIILKVISIIFGIIGVGSLLLIGNSPDLLDELGKMGLDTSIYQLDAISLTITSVIIIIQVVIVVMAIMNAKKIKNMEQINNLPYILILIVQAYSIIDTVISLISGIEVSILVTIISALIGTLISVGPAVMVLLKNKEIGKLEEEN